MYKLFKVQVNVHKYENSYLKFSRKTKFLNNTSILEIQTGVRIPKLSVN